MQVFAKEDISLKEATEKYIKERKFNEAVIFLSSIAKQKKSLAPEAAYFIGLSRYSQLKYLEGQQLWDEYFSSGNDYRAQLVSSLKEAIGKLSPQDDLSVYSRLLLWKFHKDQNDADMDRALQDLMGAVDTFSSGAKDIAVIKDTAKELAGYDEKASARRLYKLYADKIIASQISDGQLRDSAETFLNEGNPDLAENLFDSYIKRIESLPKEKSNLIPELEKIAQEFAYKDKEANDPLYAEKIFQKIDGLAGKEGLSEELTYLRAYNLEKARAFSEAKDAYASLLTRFPSNKRFGEALYKKGLIYAYCLRDIPNAMICFQALEARDGDTAWVASSLYQLGLLNQWQGDLLAAKEYYNKITGALKGNYPEAVALATERLKEINNAQPIEYNLKTFLDLSFKEEYAKDDTAGAELSANPYRAKSGQSVDIKSAVARPQAGCTDVKIEYLWSGYLGNAPANSEQPEFTTSYSQPGTKEINLVVVSPNGALARALDIADVD